ncbi:hypothetical protein SLA2020_371430 [Shorea laevis]
MSGVRGSLISTSASSSSRLSPLARPFTIKTSSRHENVNPSLDFSSQGFASGVDHPFSQLSLDAYPHHAYHSDATAIAVVPFQDYTPNSYFKDYAIEEYPIQTDFTCHTSESPQSYGKNDLLNLGNVAHEGGMVDIMTYGVQGRASDQQGKGRMPFKERMGAGLSMSSNTLPEQGKHALERLQHSGETPSALHGIGNLTMTESNQNRSKDRDRINPKSSLPPLTSEIYSFPSDLWPSTTLHDTQSCLSCTNPVTFWSYCDSNISPKERYPPPNIDSYGTKPTVSNAPPYYSSLPLVFKPSVTSIKPSTFDPVSVVNVDSGGSGAITKIDDNFGYPGSRVEAYGLQDQKDSVACHEQITGEKIKGRKSSEPVRNEVISPLAGGKSELQVVVPSVANDLTLEPQDSKSSVTVDKPSTLNDHNDSDLDSPCWKGRQAYQSPFQVSEPLNSQLSKDETVRRNSLNPLAPQFFPGKGKRNVDDHQGEHHGYNSFSFQKTTALAVAVSSREDRLMYPVRAETYLSEVSSITGTQSSNNALQSGKELGLFNKSNRSPLLNASSSGQPYIVEDFHKADSLLVTEAIGFVEGVNDTVHDVSGSSLSFHMAESLNSPSSGVDVFSSFDERFQGLSKSKPNIDNELLINAMHDLSKLLLLNCSSIDSLNESEHDRVQNIINNLNVCVRNRVGQRAPMPDSGHLSNSFGTLQSADHHKEMLDSFSQSSDAVLERGQHVTQMQVVDKVRTENQGIGENMHPEALVYRNLWLETASALSLVKSKHKASL